MLSGQIFSSHSMGFEVTFDTLQTNRLTNTQDEYKQTNKNHNTGRIQTNKQTKNTTQKTKKMSNMDLTKKHNTEN